ncbi:MAG: hypothetical protein WAU78_02305 [Roseiarcus sp.]
MIAATVDPRLYMVWMINASVGEKLRACSNVGIHNTHRYITASVRKVASQRVSVIGSLLGPRMSAQSPSTPAASVTSADFGRDAGR